MARGSSSKNAAAGSPKPEPRNLAPIVVAIIGVVGPICAAYIGYLGVQSQIQAARPTPLPGPVASSTGAAATTDRPTIQPAAATPTTEGGNVATRPPAVVVPPTPVSAAPLRITITESCRVGRVIPDSIDPSQDPVGSRAAIDRDANWARAPEPGATAIPFNLFVTSLAPKEWMQVGNALDVSVITEADVPEHVNVLQDCAGGGVERAFPPVPLDSGLNRYTKSTVFPDFPFFTLQPGEFESFLTPYECRAPGVYRAHGELHYLYAGVQDSLGFNPPVMVCPRSVTHWSALADPRALQRAETLIWRGDRYAEAEP